MPGMAINPMRRYSARYAVTASRSMQNPTCTRMTNRTRHGIRLILIAVTLCFLAGCHLLGYNPNETDSHGKL
jgi:hypothetical protein